MSLQLYLILPVFCLLYLLSTKYHINSYLFKWYVWQYDICILRQTSVFLILLFFSWFFIYFKVFKCFVIDLEIYWIYILQTWGERKKFVKLHFVLIYIYFFISLSSFFLCVSLFCTCDYLSRCHYLIFKVLRCIF